MGAAPHAGGIRKGRDRVRILVVGAGSTGGYFGGRLAQTGRDVTFLVRPARAAALRAKGLQIVSPYGDVTLAPQLVTADALEEPFDVVLLTVKAFALDAALADMAPAVGPQTMILPVLNGMRHVDRIVERFGAPALVGCVAKIATNIDGEGRIVQLSRLQDLAYGEMDGARSARVQALDATMQGAGFPARLSPDIQVEMWEKWDLLAAIGAICCLMRGNVGEVNAAPGGTAFAIGLIDEVVAVVTAEGHPPRPAYLAEMRKMLTDPASTGTSSMYRDLVQGRPVEAEQIVGDMVARGARHEVATPLLNAAYANLSVYQKQIAKG
jgi:2-dehydropantoate 2-reductase